MEGINTCRGIIRKKKSQGKKLKSICLLKVNEYKKESITEKKKKLCVVLK
jgi:hypothetical protein